MDLEQFIAKLQAQKITDHRKAVQDVLEQIEQMPFDKAIILINAVSILAMRMAVPQQK